jgi:hypothetical protein
MRADDLCGIGWIGRDDLAFRLQALTPDNEVILAAQLASHLGERRLHGALILSQGEIDEFLVYKPASRGRSCNFGSRVRSSHHAVILARTDIYPLTSTL